MTLRRYLNVAWQVMIKDVDPDAVGEIERLLNAAPRSPAEEAAEQRRQLARQNQSAFANLSNAFATGQ